MSNSLDSSKKPISLFEAVLPLIVMFICLLVGAFSIGMGTELLVIVMLTAAAVAWVYCEKKRCFLGRRSALDG